MTNKNVYEVSNSKLTPSEVKKLVAASKYSYGLTNKTKILIPFKTTYGNLKGDYIVYADLKNMVNRINNYIKSKKRNPSYANVRPVSTAPTVVPPASASKGYFQKLFETKRGSVTNIKQVTEKIRGLGYSGYKNAYDITILGKSVGSVVANINRLGKNAMNCVDYTAIIATLAIEMGYKVEVLQIQCTGVTHLLCRVWGKEYGNNKQLIDSAPMASKSSPYCAFGKTCWCAVNGKPKKIVAINPKWFFNMFSDDLLK